MAKSGEKEEDNAKGEKTTLTETAGYIGLFDRLRRLAQKANLEWHPFIKKALSDYCDNEEKRVGMGKLLNYFIAGFLWGVITVSIIDAYFKEPKRKYYIEMPTKNGIDTLYLTE